MLRSYLTTALRSLRTGRLHAGLNLAGMAVGMACCLLILLWVVDELSYDRFHEKADRIYRIALDVKVGDREVHSPLAPAALGPELAERMPLIEAVARLQRVGDRMLLRADGDEFYEEGVLGADAGLFEVFSIECLRGDCAGGLARPDEVVVTEDFARRVYGSADAVGRRLTGFSDWQVAGVARSLPDNSHFHFDVLVSLASRGVDQQDPMAAWGNYNYHTYLLMRPETRLTEVETLMDRLVEEQAGDMMRSTGAEMHHYLQPLTDIHLRSHLYGELEQNGSAAHVLVFAGIAALVLVIACANFTNLTTARAARRAREVGLRKAVGAGRRQLVGQFLGEGMLLCALSLALGVALAEAVLPAFNGFTGKVLSLEAVDPVLLAGGLLAIVVVAGLGGGLYPALFLSGYEPAAVLKEARGKGSRRGPGLRRVLVVGQFATSTALIALTLGIGEQVDFLRAKELGFDHANVVVVQLASRSAAEAVTGLRDVAAQLPGVEAVAWTRSLPGTAPNRRVFQREGAPEGESFAVTQVDVSAEYLETLGIEILEGRALSADRPADERACLVNETAVRALGQGPAVGKRLVQPDDPGPPLEIVGVVRDFHFESLHTPIQPLVLRFGDSSRSSQGYLLLRINGDRVTEVLAELERDWRSLVPGDPFEYSFLDDRLDKLYRSEQRLGTALRLFSGLAVFVACLGLFGLISHTTEQRTKEIGVRKVLGATTASIVELLSREFTRTVLLAIPIAWPVAWWLTGRWLQGFAYRAEVGWMPLLLAGGGALLLAWLTMSLQAVRAGRLNPVKALRYE